MHLKNIPVCTYSVFSNCFKFFHSQDEDDDELLEDINERSKTNTEKNFLITQPRENGSSNEGSDSDEFDYDDDNDIVSDVKKKPVYTLYSNEVIYNDKDWETDLDGIIKHY